MLCPTILDVLKRKELRAEAIMKKVEATAEGLKERRKSIVRIEKDKT